jgi:hypothetical protein
MSGKSSKMKNDTKKRRKTSKVGMPKKRQSKKSSPMKGLEDAFTKMFSLPKSLQEIEDKRVSEGTRKTTIREANQQKAKIRDLISKQGRVTKTRIIKPSQAQREADEENDASFKKKEAITKKTKSKWGVRKDTRDTEDMFGKLGGYKYKKTIKKHKKVKK